MAWKQNSMRLKVGFLLILCCVFLHHQVRAQGEETQETTEEYNTENIYEEYDAVSEQRKYESSELSGQSLDEQKLKERAEKLNYDEKLEKEKPRKNDIRKTNVPKSQKSFWAGGEAKTIAYIIAFVLLAALLVYVLFTLTKGNQENVEAPALVYGSDRSPDAEELRNMDLETAFQKAINAGDYRLAIRILYLKILKAMMEQGMVRPAAEKTNMDYVRELHGNNNQQAWRSVTTIFEYTWYGDSRMDQQKFSHYRAAFDNLYSNIRLNR